MKILFFGLGSIGIRRARILIDNFRHELYAFRSTDRPAGNSLGIREVRTWGEVKNLKPDVAFITNPTFLHVETALKCALSGMHLFIEKPLSHNLDGLSSLESVCRKKKLTCYVGYCLRFHPVIEKMRELIRSKKVRHARVTCTSYLPDWRQGQDFRKSYSVSSKKGGGVILELSHELDYIQHLFGKIDKLEGSFGRSSCLAQDAENFADILITAGRTFVNVHLDYFSRISERSIKVDFDGGYAGGDLMSGRIDYLYRGVKNIFRFDMDRDKYLKKEMRYFFDNIGKASIMNSLRKARPLLEKIVEMKSAE